MAYRMIRGGTYYDIFGWAEVYHETVKMAFNDCFNEELNDLAYGFRLCLVN